MAHALNTRNHRLYEAIERETQALLQEAHRKELARTRRAVKQLSQQVKYCRRESVATTQNEPRHMKVKEHVKANESFKLPDEILRPVAYCGEERQSSSAGAGTASCRSVASSDDEGRSSRACAGISDANRSERLKIFLFGEKMNRRDPEILHLQRKSLANAADAVLSQRLAKRPLPTISTLALVAKKLERKKGMLGNTPAAEAGCKFSEVPLVDDVCEGFANKNAKVAEEATVAELVLDEEQRKTSPPRYGPNKHPQRQFCHSTPACESSRIKSNIKPQRTRTYCERHAVAVPLTTEQVYMEDQEATSLGKKQEKVTQLWCNPSLMAQRGMLKSNYLRLRHRDEIRREDIWQEYTARCETIESRGPGFMADEVVVERHPIFRFVADLSYSEFTKLLEKLHNAACKNVMETVHKSWKKMSSELRLQMKQDSSSNDSMLVSIAESRSNQGSKIDIASAAFAQAIAIGIRPPALQPSTPPHLADWDCLVAGVDHRVEPMMEDVKIWVHRRRRRKVCNERAIDNASEEDCWKPWRWRIIVYHVATGTTRFLTLSQVAILDIVDEMSSPEAKAQMQKRAAEAVAAAQAVEAATNALYYDIAQWDPESVASEDADKTAIRAAQARSRDRAALVEGMTPQGSLSRAASLMPFALALIPLLRLETRELDASAIVAAADRAYDNAVRLLDGGPVTEASLAQTLFRDHGALAKNLGLPPLFDEKSACRMNKGKLCSWSRNDVMRRVFSRLWTPMRRAKSTNDLVSISACKTYVHLDVEDDAAPKSARQSKRATVACDDKELWDSPPTKTTAWIGRMAWRQFFIEREERFSTLLIDSQLLTLAAGACLRSEAVFGTDVDEGDDGPFAAAAPEPGYAGVQGFGGYDCDGLEGDGGARWESEADPTDLAPLALRICELSGEIHERKVPGVVPIGAPLLGSSSNLSRAIGMFTRNEAWSSSDSVIVTVAGAFDQAYASPSVGINEASTMLPPPDPSDQSLTTQSGSCVLPSIVDHARSSEHLRRGPKVEESGFLTSGQTPTVKIALLFLDEAPSAKVARLRDLAARQGGFRRETSYRQAWRLKDRCTLRTSVFGIRERALWSHAPIETRRCGPPQPGVSTRCIWTSVQRCVEQLCRRRDALDFLNLLKRTVGNAVPRPLVYRLRIAALDETTYTQFSLLQMTDVEWLAEHRAAGARRKREMQHERVAAQLSALRDNVAYVELAQATTRRKLRAKALRLIEHARGLGDSIGRWRARLEGSVVVETRGTWEKRRKAAIFYYNVDDLAGPPRFSWDPPACWEESLTIERNAPEKGVALRKHGDKSYEKQQHLRDERVERIAATLASDETFIASLANIFGQSYVPPHDQEADVLSHDNDSGSEDREWWWSDSDDEVGDAHDWRHRLRSKLLPQDHADAQLHREVRLRIAREPSTAYLSKSNTQKQLAPEIESPGWRRLQWHRGGQYWRLLPRAKPASDFFHRITTTVVCPTGWVLTKAPPALASMVGIVHKTRDDKSWGSKRTDILPQSLVTTIFIRDPPDAIERVVSTNSRRAQREATVAVSIPLPELVERGPQLYTTAEEIIAKDEYETALLEGRVDDAKDELKQRALFAARSNNIADLEACVDTFGVDLEIADEQGNTPLILSAQQNDVRIVRFLLRRGANINAQNYAGNTVLHFCFGYAYNELGKWLISKDALLIVGRESSALVHCLVRIRRHKRRACKANHNYSVAKRLSAADLLTLFGHFSTELLVRQNAVHEVTLELLLRFLVDLAVRVHYSAARPAEYKSKVSTVEGAGFEIRRSVGSHHVTTAETDPFLMLDELPKRHFRPGEFPGAPWHPHRGMDTVMYVKLGRGSHEDSMGNKGTLNAGDAQWMTAASGIEHNEGTNHPGGLSHGFQMWLNLPAAHKMDPPSYNDISASAIPKVTKDWGTAAVIAGVVDGVNAPVKPICDVQYIDFMLNANSEYAHTVPAGLRTCIIHIYRGSGTFGASKVAAIDGDCVMFGVTDAESIVSFRAGSDGLDFMFMAGRPLKEPVCWHGPFVMNTQAEIQQCFKDLQSGTFIKSRGAYRRI